MNIKLYHHFKYTRLCIWNLKTLDFLNEFFFKLYLFLAVLGFRCCEHFSLVVVRGLLLWQSTGSRLGLGLDQLQ